MGNFALGILGALLTAFYMTRQVFHVFFGNCRLELGRITGGEQRTVAHGGEPAAKHPHDELPAEPHESPPVMTWPLIILAVCAAVLGFLGTPAWPWFQSFLENKAVHAHLGALAEREVSHIVLISTAVALSGIVLGWWLYGRKTLQKTGEPDPLEKPLGDLYPVLQRKYWIDELYEHSVVAFTAWWAKACDALDRWFWNGAVQLISLIVLGVSWVNRFIDEFVVNLGFDESCRGVTLGGRLLSRLQDGRVQHYLRIIGIALAVLVLVLLWGCGR